MLACIPHSPWASFIATMFLACWHAAAFRDHVWKCWVDVYNVLCVCVFTWTVCLTCSLMGTVFAHCLTAAQGAIVYFTAVLFPVLLLSSSFLSFPPLYFPWILLSLCSNALVPTRVSIHNSLIPPALDCVVDRSTDFQTIHSVFKCERHVLVEPCVIFYGNISVAHSKVFVCVFTHSPVWMDEFCLYGWKLMIIWMSQKH